jgi:putative ABC transport system permease protein
MIFNYIKIAFRNILRHKLDSFLNIAGLVIGMATALMITLVVRDELSYDRGWADSDRIYRVQTTWVIPGRKNIELVVSSGPLKPALENYFGDQIERVARLNYGRDTVITATEQYREVIGYADPGLLDIFDLEIVAGDARAALADHSSIILSEALAARYFGDEEALGQTLTLADMEQDYTVAAIMQDLPRNTHLVIDAIIAIEENHPAVGGMFTSWNQANNHIYMKLAEGVRIDEIEARLSEFIDATLTSPPEGFEKASDFLILINQPLEGIHLDGQGAGARKAGGDRDVVHAFAIIAVLLVIVAAINFINLSTARAGRRAREVALRKVLGASRWQLLIQHMGEAFMVILCSALVALSIVELMLPFLGSVLDKDLSPDLADPFVGKLIAVTVLLLGAFSGFYPSIILSAFRPAQVLKANQSAETRGTTTVRSVLVVFQSAVTIALVVATSVVFAQVTYFRTADRGFQADNLLVVNGLGTDETRANNETFKAEVLKLPGVSAATLVLEAPTRFFEQNVRLWVPEHDGETSLLVGTTRVDPDYFNTMQIPLLAGRGYDSNRPLDMQPNTEGAVDGDVFYGNIIINAAAVKVLGLGDPSAAIGEVVRLKSDTDDGAYSIDLTIIGVAGNALIHSVKVLPRPEIYMQRNDYTSLVVRFSNNPAAVRASVKSVWQAIYSNQLFDHYFVEEALAREYQVEKGQMGLFFVFAVLTIVIGCLGLYGLAAFVTERRTREIGIRKVFGASVRNIINQLMWQFSKPVLVANVIAWPVASYFMIDWLSQYPARLDSVWIGAFCINAGLFALIIALATVGTQAWQVARTNPIHALRYE